MPEIVLPLLFAAPSLFLWIIEKPLGIRFVNNITTFTSFGQIFGLAGTCLLIYVIIFSTRPKFLEDKFGGLDKIYKSHHKVGIFAWVFLLMHPLMLSFAQLHFSFLRIFKYFIPGQDLIVNLGIFAIFIMIILLSLTLFFRPTFKTWKITHKFLALVVLLGTFHSLLVGSDISRFLPLKIYMMMLLLLGIILVIYQIFLSNTLKKKYKYKVFSVSIKNRIADIEFNPNGEAMKYKPGQFIFVQFISKKISNESHPFSIAPGKGKNFRIIVKLQGDYTNLLDKLEIGTKTLIEGPYGRFWNSDIQSQRQIWIGGGIGVVPILSMINSVRDDANVDFYYLVGNKFEALYLNEILSYSKSKKFLRVIPYYSEDLGHINATKIKNMSGEIIDTEFYICGPKNMTLALTKSLQNEGLEKKFIHAELFEY